MYGLKIEDKSLINESLGIFEIRKPTSDRTGLINGSPYWYFNGKNLKDQIN